ncbi:ephrin type-A receptor 4a [Strongylocentrotus purpuratus]|uniref:Protein kinase domain-containing protein n=1 Tax=Strongylocentrotus purpuratus TaxID=7668 RepID=A0A7M7NBH9_STRPU|nr:ephrin type-A receptor 4a [Strongylocentrotus purpuratus]
MDVNSPDTPTYIPPKPAERSTLPPPDSDPCSSCPRLLPEWALAVLIVLLLVVAISVGLNVMFVYKKRRLQRDLAIKAHLDMQKSSYTRKSNGNDIAQDRKAVKPPILRTKTIALKKSRIEIPRENIGISVSLRSIGDGQFGHVWKGETRGLTVNDGHVIPVAARELPASLTDDDILDNLVPLWSLKTHENVVQVFGCCLKTEPSYILTEYVPNGTLFTYLRTNGGIARTSVYANIDTLEADHQITVMEQNLFAFDVANGMEYLANKKVIHGNLCAHNILLTGEKRCKVADFGLTTLSNLVTKDGIYEMWMSPERLSDGLCSAEDDVWAYGVLVWEIMTYGRRPYSELGKENLQEMLISGYRLIVPQGCDQTTANLMKSCWQEKEGERPTFEKIKNQLGDKVEEEADYFALGSNMDSYYACVNVIDS